jgi:streptomycin 6-kinase
VMITVPIDFTADIIRRYGEVGQRWLASLPAQIEDICTQWALNRQNLLGFGTWSVVYAVEQWGRPAALKVAWPHDDGTFEREVSVLKLWNGEGAVRALRVDAPRQAILLERLDATTRLAHIDIEDALRIAGRLLRRHAVMAPPGLPTLAAITSDLIENIEAQWERLHCPMNRATIERTRVLARQLLPGIGDVLVNWDLHFDNVLRGTREPWLVIDPQVVSGDLEYGVAQLLWWRLEEIEARGGVLWALEVLAEAGALNSARLLPWVYVRTVAYWLSGLEAGLTIDPVRCQRIIAALEGCPSVMSSEG